MKPPDPYKPGASRATGEKPQTKQADAPKLLIGRPDCKEIEPELSRFAQILRRFINSLRKVPR